MSPKPCLHRQFTSFFRLSVFFTTRVDGVLEIWDFLYQQKGPILPVKVADYPLLSMKVAKSSFVILERYYFFMDTPMSHK